MKIMGDVIGSTDVRQYTEDGEYSFRTLQDRPTLALTGTAILPMEYARLYMEDRELVHYVDNQMNCEDIG